MTRVLIGGVGYRSLRDHSFGVVLVDSLAIREWPPAVSVEDISYNPIAVVQRLQDDPEDHRFDLLIVAGAMRRPNRLPGTLSVYRWDNVLPGPDRIQAAITEAVTGIIALDNTLIVARHFDALPRSVVVVELEPDAHEFGDALTPAASAALTRAREIIIQLACDPAAAERIPQGALAAERVCHTGVVLEQVIHGDSRVH